MSAFSVQGSSPYTAGFYDARREGSRASAKAVLSLVLDWLCPGSIIDIGCGECDWLSVAQTLGITDITGIDGSYIDRSRLPIDPSRFTPVDLVRPFTMPRTFDLAMSLEVAEHLPSDSADGFVASITALAPAVLFSAAMPGQGGTNHLNEQWPAYWADRFAARGYVCFDAIRPLVWADASIDVWYRQNVLLYIRSDHPLAALPALRHARTAKPLDLVHPEVFSWARNPGLKTSARLLYRAATRKLGG
jgi:SAM-dependent methyltransferase